MSRNPNQETLPEPGLASSTPPDSMLGKVLKTQYSVDAQLGQGAMGVVYRGTQLSLGKTVAIKMIRADILVTKESHDRFVREAQVLSKLLHPGIAQVLDFGIADGVPFLVMEFVDGKELTDVMKLEGPMAPSRAILIIRQLAAALEEAHRNGVVHRDIKPHNIRLQRYSPTGPVYLKVLDFGIAKQLGDEVGTSLTATGAVIGTPAYMAPEQAGGSRIDAKADQYAVGVVLYELLTGSVPFTSDTVTGVLVSHLTKPPPPLPKEVPEPLAKIVMRLLEKEPSARYPDIATLERTLSDCEAYCRDARPLSRAVIRPIGSDGRNPKRPWFLIVGGAAAAALLVSATVLVLARSRHSAGSASVGAAKPQTVLATSVVEPPKTPTEPVGATTPSTQPVSGQGTATKPETKPEPVAHTAPPPKIVENRPAKSKPAATAPTSKVSAKSGTEPAEIKEKLDQADRLLQAGDYQKAVELARQTLFTHPTSRAFRQLTFAHCKMGSFAAKAMFFRVAPADRKSLISVCEQNGVTLR